MIRLEDMLFDSSKGDGNIGYLKKKKKNEIKLQFNSYERMQLSIYLHLFYIFSK